MTAMTPDVLSVQTDRFVHDRLPPPELCAELRFDLPELRIPAQANLVDVLFAHIEERKLLDAPFLRSEPRTLTYREAAFEVARIAQVLTCDCALVPGNRVLLRGGNTVGMALAWLGVVKAGLIAVATMPLLRAKELGEVMDKAQPNLALCDGALLAELEAACSQRAQAMRVVAFNAAASNDSLEALAAAQSGNFAPCLTAASDIALLAFTSGTTGKPKAAVHSHGAVLAACQAWPRHVLKALPSDIVMGSPPLAFTFGLGGLLLFPFACGASTYFPSAAYTPEVMVKLMAQVGATICYTAPTFYRQMAPFAAQHGLKQVRLCISAGEALPDATRQLWKAASGIEMLDGIGSTELFHIFISSAPGDVRPGAIGKVVPGYHAKVVGEDGQELPRGQVGALAVIGPTRCMYLDDARQSVYVHHGWNQPGDAFVQDADGYFFYQSRADDMIVTSGYNVGGPEVEEALLQHPAVLEAAVIGAPDAERGMVVKAFVVLKNGLAGDDALAKTLQDHVKALLAPYKYPRQIVFLDRLPRTETGKLQRFKLRAMGAEKP
jgi:2-aminobenzoate-CoA ligase